MDPWEEFLPTTAASMPSLAVLDDRCRCSICKDYLQGPMMTLCGHTFCSICIRRALNADGRCPICRSLEEESKLRKNLMIEEIVEAFLPFRTSLMAYAPTSITNDHDVTDERNERNGSQIEEVSDSESGSALANPSSSLSPPPPTIPRPRRTTRSHNQNRVDADTLPPNHILCPICQAPIHQDKADYHVNRCLEGKATPPQIHEQVGTNSTGQSSPYFNSTNQTDAKSRTDLTSNRSTTPTTTNVMKRMPKMSYAAMTDAKLRKTMTEMGINSSGSRAQLQRRCTEFITMWNSNLDNKYPKTKRDLIADMRAWDRVQARPVQRSTNEEIDDAHQSGKYDDSFKDLISKARESLKKRKVLEREKSRESVQGNRVDIDVEDRHTTKRQHIE